VIDAGTETRAAGVLRMGTGVGATKFRDAEEHPSGWRIDPITAGVGATARHPQFGMRLKRQRSRISPERRVVTWIRAARTPLDLKTSASRDATVRRV